MKDEARIARPGRLGWLPLLAALLLAACSGDGTESLPPETAEVGVVLSSTDVSLTIFEVENPVQTRIVGLGPDGSPVTMAVRGHLAAVPLGFVPAVAVVDLKDGLLVRTVPLPQDRGRRASRSLTIRSHWSRTRISTRSRRSTFSRALGGVTLRWAGSLKRLWSRVDGPSC